LPSSAPTELSIALGLKAAALSIAAGHASGLSAVALAAEEVATGRLSACLCGEFELAGFRGVRAAAEFPSDFIALFWVCPATGRAGEVAVAHAAHGFSPRGVGEGAPAVEDSPAILELARACAEATGRRSIAARDPAGFWATIALES
jgi:hypothetical protein